jgi:hypothetical protein
VEVVAAFIMDLTEIVPGTTYLHTKTRIFHKRPGITPCSDSAHILRHRGAAGAAATNANANAKNANANANAAAVDYDARARGCGVHTPK